MPNVIIWDTFFFPYFLATYFNTSSLFSWQKSISKSGRVTLFGFRNLSKSKPYFIGSKSVIPNAQATSDPAPEPLPGPTGIFFLFAHEIKSETIKKYPE